MKRLPFLFTFLLVAAVADAQDTGRWSSSIYLQAAGKADVTVPFSVYAEGKKYSPDWGLDQAWIDEGLLARGVNHMGKQNVTIGRSSYRVWAPLVGDSALTADQIEGLKKRADLFKKHVGATLPLVLNCDNGYVPDDVKNPASNINEYYTKNRKANITNWANMLDAHVAWMQANTRHPIVGVSVMNEPDFDGNRKELIQGTAADIRDISKTLKEDYPRFKDLIITGPNTLNDDYALPWYNTCKQYVDWGNTHQLAGSFDNYAGFHEQLAKDGKVGLNDEMHNVAEAFIGLEYGMTKGIWWGFDSRARGEFCQISREGSRLAYAEHRNNWTAATVYRNDQTGQIKAFVGSSERQAFETAYQFLNLDDAVYYDGHGPYHEWCVTVPGGTKYQTGQTNAERVIDVVSGEDVPSAPINGSYIIMNKYNTLVVSQGGSVSGHMGIDQERYAKLPSQQWEIIPVPERVGGDFSFYHIRSKNDGRRINVLNHSTATADLICYDANGDINEQWYLEYAGDGCYFIRNRESALYLTSQSRSKTEYAKINQNTLLSSTQRDRQLWRIIPVDADCETTVPQQPKGLTAKAGVASVRLEWTANEEADLDGYMILRAEASSDRWNTIARKVKATWFVDNTCVQGRSYQYKVKAIDRSDNQSECSDVAEAAPTGEPAMIARWHMDGDLQDVTPNMMDAAAYGTPSFVVTHKSGEKSLSMNGTSTYIQLPYRIADSEELSIVMWVYWSRPSTNNTWQRIFDFGNGTSYYMFLTPDCGNGMRFAIKNGGDEQQLTCTALPSGVWRHVTVTLAKGKTTIYVNGEEAGSTSAITITPRDIHPALNYLGRSQFTADPLFSGRLDDVRIYNYALSADEVRQSMEDVTNGISNVQQNEEDVLPVYDVRGVRRSQMLRGLNIVGGKKVVVR